MIWLDIIKILILSLILSIAIKYGGQAVAIAPTQTNVLLGILLPPVLMAIALAWRKVNQSKSLQKNPRS